MQQGEPAPVHLALPVYRSGLPAVLVQLRLGRDLLALVLAVYALLLPPHVPAVLVHQPVAVRDGVGLAPKPLLGFLLYIYPAP